MSDMAGSGVKKFVTTRSLDRGVIREIVLWQHSRNRNYWRDSQTGWSNSFKAADVHDTHEQALAAAEAKRAAKVALLRKQLAKLEALVFS